MYGRYQQILVSSLIVLAKPLLMIFFLPGSPHSPASTRPKIGNENSPSPGQTVTFRHLTNVPTPLRSWRAYWMTSTLFTLGVLTLLGKRPWQVYYGCTIRSVATVWSLSHLGLTSRIHMNSWPNYATLLG